MPQTVQFQILTEARHITTCVWNVRNGLGGHQDHESSCASQSGSHFPVQLLVVMWKRRSTASR